MIYNNIITTSLERGKNDDDDVIDLKTYFVRIVSQMYGVYF